MQKIDTLTDPTKQIIRQYFIGKNDTEWLESAGIETLSLKDTLAKLKAERHEDYRKIARLVIGQMFRNPEADHRMMTRKQQVSEKLRQFVELNVPYVPDGVDGYAKPFDDYEPLTEFPDTATAKSLAIAWADGNGKPILTLSGSPGVGKTHLAKAAALYLLNQDAEIVFRRDVDFFSEIRRAVKNNELDRILDGYGKFEYLILDDFGVSAPGASMRGYLDGVIDTRWSNAHKGLRTMITTNLVSDQMEARIASRLRPGANVEALIIKADDYRRNE